LEQRHATRSYLGAREEIKRFCRAQTMTEYVLILAAVAVVVFVTYLVMGQSVIKLTNRVNSTLTTS
jgi:Flp pilus assembly pilin Flp